MQNVSEQKFVELYANKSSMSMNVEYSIDVLSNNLSKA